MTGKLLSLPSEEEDSAWQEITWEPTYIDYDSAQTVTIRKGDSLLLTAYEEGGTDLEIDADGDGIFELTGANDQRFPVLYDTGGFPGIPGDSRDINRFSPRRRGDSGDINRF